jgi:hypothetical protein
MITSSIAGHLVIITSSNKGAFLNVRFSNALQSFKETDVRATQLEKSIVFNILCPLRFTLCIAEPAIFSVFNAIPSGNTILLTQEFEMSISVKFSKGF